MRRKTVTHVTIRESRGLERKANPFVVFLFERFDRKQNRDSHEQKALDHMKDDWGIQT